MKQNEDNFSYHATFKWFSKAFLYIAKKIAKFHKKKSCYETLLLINSILYFIYSNFPHQKVGLNLEN